MPSLQESGASLWLPFQAEAPFVCALGVQRQSLREPTRVDEHVGGRVNELNARMCGQILCTRRL